MATIQTNYSISTDKAQAFADIPKVHLWHYVKSEEDLYGGKRRLFAYRKLLRKEEKEITRRLFPAIEPEFCQLRGLFEGVTCLGYHLIMADDGMNFMWLPGKRALEFRYREVQDQNIDLKDLKILDSRGIATDMAFIKAFLDADGLLCSGIESGDEFDPEEHVHDHCFHLIVTLKALLSNPLKYYEAKEKMVAFIRPIYEKMLEVEEDLKGQNAALTREELVKLQKAIGGVVDVMWAYSPIRLIQMGFTSIEDPIRDVWLTNEFYNQHWQDCFGEEFDLEEMQNILRKIDF